MPVLINTIRTGMSLGSRDQVYRDLQKEHPCQVVSWDHV